MIAGRYRSLLEHLGPTVALTDLRRSQASDGVALRHDIDHDLGVALDMSAMEREVGERRATYFILHTQAYCQDKIFIDRLRQLVDDGHEIGLHLDAIGAWWRGETDDPFGDLGRWLDRVRSAGIQVVASAAHGAKACYEGGFANHWIWSELRGDDPAATMDGISAEGIEVPDPAFQIRYPLDHRIRRGDGATLELWSCSMASNGIEYEACTVPVDRYWSDSGGDWKRSPDPLGHDLSRGRHQVLVHPWWWREPRRHILVLGTARTGTKWLCGRLAAGTSARVLHERTLNQDGRSIDQAPGLKRTASDLVGLLEDVGRVKRLVDDAFVARHVLRRDTIEANVYLPHVDPQLLRREGVTIVHLHRDPSKVVRSILERGWYDTADDRRHPRFEVETHGRGWDAMTRFERACTYWAETNLRLLREFPDAIRVAAEDLQADDRAVHELAVALGFPWHAVPASCEDAPVDRTSSWTVPPVEEWSERDRLAFLDICGPVAALLGRRVSMPEPCVVPESASSSDAADPDAVHHQADGIRSSGRIRRGRTHHCQWKPRSPRTFFKPSIEGGPIATSEPNAWFGLDRGIGWDGRRRDRRSGRSRRASGDVVVEGRFDARVRRGEEGVAGDERWVGRLFVLGLDRDGDVVDRRPLLRLEPDPDGVVGGRFSVHLRDARVVEAVPLVLVEVSETDWVGTNLELEWCVDRPRSPRPVGSSSPMRSSSAAIAAGPCRDREIEACRRLDSTLVAEHRAKHERRRLFVPEDYEFLLADFADHETLTLADYARLPEVGDRRILLIRHDVDHDLETAVRMATWEAERSIRATYCLLHTTWYWGVFDGRRYRRTRDLVEAGDRLLELGHEINFHNNLATLALQTGCEPGRVLEAELGFMRSLGWPVCGTATHGDRLCHQLNYGNFELFEHAVKLDRGGPRRLFTDEGAVTLGRLRQEDFGLEYEAYDIHRDLYISDSGGRMRGQRDAPGRRAFGRVDRSRGSVAGILTHPIWWRFPEQET
jgi:hypothetical protein